MRDIKSIIVHCSDSPFGNAALIDQWHKARGWRGIGYHEVILNAYPHSENYTKHRLDPKHDGLVQHGREWDQVGAHVRGHNKDSIGICLIGVDVFSSVQIKSLSSLIANIWRYHPDAELYGHYEFNHNKTCPNIDMDWLRDRIIEPLA